MTTERQKSARIGVYECTLTGNLISKGKRITGYYGILPLQELRSNPLDSTIMRDLRARQGEFQFPVLVVSYPLAGNLPLTTSREELLASEWHPKLDSKGRLTTASAKKAILEIEPRRKKIPEFERWVLVIDAGVRIHEVEGHRIKA